MSPSTDKPLNGNWSRYRERICYSLHECAFCGGNITLGQQYRDGGYGRRAHSECVAGMTAAKIARELVSR